MVSVRFPILTLSLVKNRNLFIVMTLECACNLDGGFICSGMKWAANNVRGSHSSPKSSPLKRLEKLIQRLQRWVIFQRKLYPVRQWRRKVLFTNFLVAQFHFLNLFFLSALEKNLHCCGNGASCWINSIMILFQQSSSLVCCILHKRDIVNIYAAVDCRKLFFINCIISICHFHTRKKTRTESHRKKQFAIVCLYIRFAWLFYPEILLCNHFLLLPTRPATQK